ncbi:EAL domain-containing protein [Lentzea tibetensis]|uniref:EAL domain-containing protein n=1 Tax=Lentzea tibetensis TaxID=2591470 RepID=A0A563EXV7_9PSEU|nr:EAL domain-containing protein [Lentzea tibetensis]TWP52378.1 EAL domain-containing protein [Lentzea tibetensis]
MDAEAKLDSGVVADLAVSADAAIMWWFDLTTSSATWMPGMGELLGVPDAGIRARLGELLEPLVVAARTAAVWQDFTLEQPNLMPDGTTRWVQVRACVSGDATAKGLTGVATDVTRRHTDRQALADLADRYRLLVELSPDAIAVHEAGVVTYANPAGIRVLGARSSAEIVGRPITDFVHPASIPEMMRRIGALTTPGAASEPAEAAIVRFDGVTVDVEAVSVRTTWEGRPAFQVILRDVTAQKAAEATLHYQAALVAHVSDAIIATTADGIVTTWNPAAETVYGRSAAEAVGRHVGTMVGARLDPVDVLRLGGVTHAVHRRADGSTLVIRVSAAEMDSGYVLVCADETARRRAEQHFTTVVASLEEGVFVVGQTGLIESANPAAERILGVREEQLVGMSTTVVPLYDERGARVPEADYPCALTRRTGLPHNGRIFRVRRRDGRDIWLSVSCRPLNQVSTFPAAVVVSFADITERRSIAARLEHDATHDALTGLANRTLVIRHLTSRTSTMSVLFVDLDKFKVINDSLGHSAGDKVLRIVGERLRRRARGGDLVGRLGGDEFVVVAHAMTHGEVCALAQHLRDAVVAPVLVDGRQLHLDASIGIVTAGPDDPRDGEDLVRDADVAMYQAKSQGRGRHVFFDVDLRERMQRRLQLEQDLRDAARNEQLAVVYQPIVDLRTSRVVSVEALLRWAHPVHGAISPSEFIPLAEESDLINLLGGHVLRTTTEQVSGLRARVGPDCNLAVNLSPRQLDDPRLVPAVQDVLRTTGLSPSTLCLEITENALMRDPSIAAETLSALRELGVRLAIDDFGTGYSSLAQLRRLPIDQLKIDRSFVAALGECRDAEEIVRSIIMMAHAVNLTVVAEGVENARQLDVLRHLECDQVQGFHIGRPTAPENLVTTG